MFRILCFHCCGPGSIPGQRTEFPKATCGVAKEKEKKKKHTMDVRTSLITNLFLKCIPTTCLAVQWLRLRASNAGAVGSIPGRGTKIPRAAWCGRKIYILVSNA